MRDNHEGMPELIRAFEKDGHYFLIIEIDWEHQKKRYQFGVLRKNYLILQRILETRTFDMMPGLKYRYFYAGSSHPLDLSSASMFVRIELGRDATIREFEIPKDLHANLLWFTQLKSIEDARYLEIADD
jgi:hypothetical protein